MNVKFSYTFKNFTYCNVMWPLLYKTDRTSNDFIQKTESHQDIVVGLGREVLFGNTAHYILH